jgi:acyl-CoA reductase-like NAD-dependent aldehyde dehydrogenase
MNMTHRFSNNQRTRESIRREAQKREWRDLPVNERIQLLEKISEVIEQVMQEAC